MKIRLPYLIFIILLVFYSCQQVALVEGDSKSPKLISAIYHEDTLIFSPNSSNHNSELKLYIIPGEKQSTAEQRFSVVHLLFEGNLDESLHPFYRILEENDSTIEITIREIGYSKSSGLIYYIAIKQGQ